MNLPNHCTSTTSAAFTLIELLIVVSIVAVLASMVLSTTNMARTSAQRTACANNQRQIALGMLAYATDNRTRMPGAVIYEDTGSGGDYTRMATTEDGRPSGVGLLVGQGLIDKSDGKIFFCPGRRKLDRYTQGGGYASKWSQFPAGNLEAGYFVATTNTWVKSGSVYYTNYWHMLPRTPADKILTFDIVGWDSTPESSWGAQGDFNARTSHKRGINAARFDGSVTWIEYTSKGAMDYQTAYLASPWTSGDENFIEYMHTKLLGWTVEKYRDSAK
jgi:prepilin-type N-terminal cleavage/methylation domain-containing protein